jgi:hypothetical protein
MFVFRSLWAMRQNTDVDGATGNGGGNTSVDASANADAGASGNAASGVAAEAGNASGASVGADGSISVPTGAGASGNGAANDGAGAGDFAGSVPADLKEKPWVVELLKKENPQSEMWKQHAELQKKLGDRPDPIPGADATDEELEKFYAKMRPESADKYAIPDIYLGDEKKDLAKHINESRNPEYVKSMQEAAFEVGIRPDQFAKLIAKSEAFRATVTEAQSAAAVEQEAKFEDGAKKLFGGDKDKALAFGKSAINTMLSKEVREYLGNASNETLLGVAAMAKAYHAKYEKEDTMGSGGGSGTIAGMTEAELNAEQRKLMALPEYGNQFHANHETVRKQIRDISNQIVEVRKQQKT